MRSGSTRPPREVDGRPVAQTRTPAQTTEKKGGQAGSFVVTVLGQAIVWYKQYIHMDQNVNGKNRRHLPPLTPYL